MQKLIYQVHFSTIQCLLECLVRTLTHVCGCPGSEIINCKHKTSDMICFIIPITLIHGVSNNEWYTFYKAVKDECHFAVSACTDILDYGGVIILYSTIWLILYTVLQPDQE